jgi:hypothetical protein
MIVPALAVAGMLPDTTVLSRMAQASRLRCMFGTDMTSLPGSEVKTASAQCAETLLRAWVDVIESVVDSSRTSLHFLQRLLQYFFLHPQLNL